MQVAKQTDNRVRGFLVTIDLQERTFRIGVADVAETGVAHGANVEYGLVTPIAAAEKHFARRFGRPTKQNASLHLFGLVHSRPGQRGRSQIDRGNKLVAFRSASEPFGWRQIRISLGPVDYQRDVQAAVVGPLFAARHRSAMIAHEQHNGVLVEPVTLETIHDESDLLVCRHDSVEILRPNRSGYRVIGIVWRDHHLGRIGRLVDVLVRYVPGGAAMRLRKVNLRVERLVVFQVAEVTRVERLVCLGIVEVPVGFSGSLIETRLVGIIAQYPDVCREVSGRPEPVGEDANTLGKRVGAVAMRPMVVGVDRHRVHAGHKR